MASGRRDQQPGFMERWDEFEARQARAIKDTPRSRAPRDPVGTLDADVLDGVPYVELHLHTHYSLLEGASSPDELVRTAVEQGHAALALTDHDGLFGAMEFARAARAEGLRPITGLELTISEPATEHDASADIGEDGEVRSHLTLLAETREGYANLCRLSSLAYGLGETDRRAQEARRVDPVVPLAALERHAAGLIVLTGCREGRIPALVQAGRGAEAATALARLIGWFGEEQVFVELQDNDVHGDRPRNEALVRLAEQTGVGVVGTGNVHYHARERHRLQDVLVAIRHRSTLDESHAERRPNAEFWLRSPVEQAERFARYHPEAAANTVRIARRCGFDLTGDLGYRLPAPPLSEGATPLGELERICRERLGDRYRSPSERAKAEAQLVEELRLIEMHDLAGFFLIYHEVFELAEEVARDVRAAGIARGLTDLPPGRGRGSSVSSIVCYLIGLSHIDPIHHGLFIGRFLNEEMDSLPDIDLDFPRDIRAELIERVHARWGREHAALVASFATYRTRGAIRDAGKALGLPVAELDRLARRAGPFEGPEQILEVLGKDPQFGGPLSGSPQSGGPQSGGGVEARGWRELAEMVPQLVGVPRHLSQHPGGMVIASEPLIDCVPCQPAAMPNRYLCHWDKDSIGDARMVKIDFLGLGMLSVVEETVDLIAAGRGRVVDLSRIDFEDEAVFDTICEGDTVGVFQIESRAQIAMLPRTQPRSLEDLTVQVSIVRPGPIVGGAVNPYVRRRELQRRNPRYRPAMPHECVREVLDETLGVVIFQEQVLQVARHMGGFTAGEADRFRRSLGRRRAQQELDAWHERFLDGAEERGVARPVAERVFGNLAGFAEFGFPKSHGAAFGLLAYQSTWLKQYYAPEFMCALFNQQPMGFYPPHVLTNDAKRHGVPVERPDINASAARCTVELPEGAIRVGLGYVRGVGEALAERVEAERERGGEYQSLFGFVQRTGLGRRATSRLIRAGAFDSLGLRRRELLWQLGLFTGNPPAGYPRVESKAAKAAIAPAATSAANGRQLRLELPTGQDMVTLPDLGERERMAADYDLLGLSPDRHPMQFLRRSLGEGVASSRHLQTLSAGRTVEVAGLVVCRQRPLTARGIIFLLLEDEYGLMNILVPRELTESRRDVVRMAPFVRARGTLDERTGVQRTLVAEGVEEVSPAEPWRMPSGKSWA